MGRLETDGAGWLNGFGVGVTDGEGWRFGDVKGLPVPVTNSIYLHTDIYHWYNKKGKGFPYSIPSSVGPGADPGLQAVSPQVTVSHPPGSRLPLLSARPAVTFPATKHHRPLAGTKLYCLVTEAHRFEQLAQGCYRAMPWVGFEPTPYWSQVQRSTHCATALI